MPMVSCHVQRREAVLISHIKIRLVGYQ